VDLSQRQRQVNGLDQGVYLLIKLTDKAINKRLLLLEARLTKAVVSVDLQLVNDRDLVHQRLSLLRLM